MFDDGILILRSLKVFLRNFVFWIWMENWFKFFISYNIDLCTSASIRRNNWKTCSSSAPVELIIFERKKSPSFLCWLSMCLSLYFCFWYFIFSIWKFSWNLQNCGMLLKTSFYYSTKKKKKKKVFEWKYFCLLGIDSRILDLELLTMPSETWSVGMLKIWASVG